MPSPSKPRLSCSARPRGRNRAPTERPAIAGTLMMKTDPHQNHWSSAPPTISPRGPDHRGEAEHEDGLRRSSGSKRTTTADIASGIRKAAPRPMTARAAIKRRRAAGVGAPGARAEDDRAHVGALAPEPVAQHTGRQHHPARARR